ncbi:hypothetical protein L596_018176 [Steinernema carpocapsae]|uniref:Uncharacterized protein n=1 Tax=Steinernema carpocapsae TaxID=34508 RepID=A0A4U5N3W0_STECR|nr:hypothetical protein L596_018176 [Steinernema carpocapsae]
MHEKKEAAESSSHVITTNRRKQKHFENFSMNEFNMRSTTISDRDGPNALNERRSSKTQKDTQMPINRPTCFNQQEALVVGHR